MIDNLQFSSATRDDIPKIVEMLQDDQLGATRELFSDPLPECYYQAFDEIETEPNNELVIARLDNEMVGFLQITFIPNLTYKGGRRALIESVRVAKSARRNGIGKALIEFAITKSRERNCRVVQLTSNKERKGTIEFYLSQGFDLSHEGFKLMI